MGKGFFNTPEDEANEIEKAQEAEKIQREYIEGNCTENSLQDEKFGIRRGFFDADENELQQIKKAEETEREEMQDVLLCEETDSEITQEILDNMDKRNYFAKAQANESKTYNKQDYPKLRKIAEKQTDAAKIVRKLTRIHEEKADIVKGFRFAEEGLFYITEKREYFVGNFDFTIQGEMTILSDIVNKDGALIGCEEKTIWEIVIKVNQRNYFASVRDEELSVGKWVEKFTKSRAYVDDTPDARKFFRRYVSGKIAAENFPQKMRYETAGWKKFSDGYFYYVVAEGVIGKPALNIYAASEYSLLIDPAMVKKQETFQKWYSMRNIFPSKLGYAVALQMYTLLSVLTTLFTEAGQPINFLMALVGTTNAKKTSTALAFTKVFGRTPQAKVDLEFTSTKGAIAEATGKYADAVLIVDDLLPPDDALADKEQREKVELLIREFASRCPRIKSKTYAAQAGAEAYTPIRGCCLFTGEVYDGRKSSQSRVLRLEYGETDVDNAQLLFHQQNLWILPTLVWDFLDYVTAHQTEIMGSIASMVIQTREEVAGNIRTPRLRETFGFFRTIVEIFYNYVIERGYMSRQDGNLARYNDIGLIRELVTQNDAVTQTASPGVSVMIALFELIETGEVHCHVVTDKTDIAMLSSKMLIEDSSFYFISAEYLWDVTNKYFQKHGIFSPYKNGKALVKLLADEGLLVSQKEGNVTRNTRKLTINGRSLQQRFIYIKKEVAKKIVENYHNF